MIIKMNYKSRLLWVLSAPSQNLSWWKPIRLSLFTVFFSSQTKKGVVVLCVIPFGPRGYDPTHFRTSWVPGCWPFCSDSSVVEAHLAEMFAFSPYTSICYTAELTVFCCRSSYDDTCSHMHREQGDSPGSWSPPFLSLRCKWCNVRVCFDMCLCVRVAYGIQEQREVDECSTN